MSIDNESSNSLNDQSILFVRKKLIGLDRVLVAMKSVMSGFFIGYFTSSYWKFNESYESKRLIAMY